MRHYEIPTGISNLARLMLTHENEHEYFLQTIDKMRWRKLYGEHISTTLLTEAFGHRGRKRIMACYKECVERGLLICHDSYQPTALGKRGHSKLYRLAPDELKPQVATATEVTDDVAGGQHSDGLAPLGCCSGGGFKTSDRPIARCAYPAYVKVDEQRAERVRKLVAAAMLSLGWDCVKQDMTDELAPSLLALECSTTNADVAAYFHMRSYSVRRRNRRGTTRFCAECGRQVERRHAADVGLSPDEMRERDIRHVSKNIADLQVGNVWARRKNGRCYHNATDVPTVFRRQWRYRMPDGTSEPAVDVDVSAMWWWELSTMISDIREHSNERDLLVRLFEMGSFYEYLRDRMLIFGAYLSDRERSDLVAFKKAVNAFILFGDRGERRSLWVAFREVFPAMANELGMLHRHLTMRQLNFVLSRIEGSYTLDYVMKELHRRNIPALPYHDGMLVPESAVDLCIALYRRRMIDITGHAPLIRAKGNAVSSEDLEAMMIDDFWGTDDLDDALQ